MGIDRGKWQGHLEAGEASGLSLAGYAEQHDIDVRRLYDARYARARASASASARQATKASAFAQVKLKAQAPATAIADVAPCPGDGALLMQAKLGNGVVLSWSHDGVSQQALSNMMHMLAELPCSR